MLEVAISIIVIIAALWIGAYLLLKGPDLSRFDEPRGTRGASQNMPSPESEQAIHLLKSMQEQIDVASLRERVPAMRRVFDQGIPGSTPEPEALGVKVVAVDAGGVPAEWVLAENADPARRLLYIHGGAFAAGSPRSHRAITSRLSRLAGVSVLAIDYRLMPENPRLASILDSQTAYRWILENGPDGACAPKHLFVAGDSAGGNLTLMLIAWIRDQGLRQVDGAIALSPATDSTLSAPSARNNIATDPMLGPMFGKLVRLPKTLILLIILFAGRMRPTNPLISPVFGDLSRLPPTLVHVSEIEMLLDDGRRWVNKARSEGSDARLETWPGMMHVWQIFAHMLPEANEALERIAAFIDEKSAQPG